MQPNHSTDLLANAASRLDTASALVDRLVACDEPELSYAATTAALHLHAAQAELPAPGASAVAPPVTPDDVTPARAVDALNRIITLVHTATASLPAGQHAALARVTLHVAEARDALNEVMT